MKTNAVVFSALMMTASAVHGATPTNLGECQNAGILDSSMFSDVPWNAMYPIKLAGITLGPDGGGAPDKASDKVFCSCQDDLGIFVPGFTQAMYEPSRLIELVRQPDCMMTLNGTDMSITNGRMRGNIGSNETLEGDKPAFWHYHYYAFPLLILLEMLYPSRCGDGYIDMDLMYISELDPTWMDSELGFFANPESAIFSNPISIAACMADAAAATVGKPIDSMYWCAGAWGELYPLAGFVKSKSSIPSKTSLLATRSIAALHRRLLAHQTMGNEALCESQIFPTIPKTQYKMNMMYPVPERGDNRVVNIEKDDGSTEQRTAGDGGAHDIGTPAIMWGEWRNIPSREDNIYMLWKWNDCCITYY